MNVILTCGGTGGHIYPAIAVAKMLRDRQKGCSILFIGADGMEKDIVPREGFRLETVRISNFQRGLTPAGLWHNLKTAADIAGSLRKADRIIRDYKPDVILGTGGYASFPALKEGARLGVPTLVHESNAVPGLATRLVADRVDRILVGFEACRENYKDPEKVLVTGTPVREDFLYKTKKGARRELGLGDDPLVVTCWGSLGAREMNKMIARFMVRNAGENAFRHIHATGSFGWRWMPQYVKDLGLDLAAHPAIDMREYIYDMPTVMAAADLVICRAGAATISEVTVSGTPAIIVPSPNVTDNHQEKNARVLEKCGAAMVLREAECTGDRLYEAARELLKSPERLGEMRKALSEIAVVDATERICAAVVAAGKAP